MNNEEEINDYNSFLRNLDNDSFISHINSLSQGYLQALRSQNEHVFQAMSTPIPTSLSRLSSDPFDDSVDEEQLARIARGENPTQEVYSQPPLEQSQQAPVGQLHAFGDYATYFHSKHLKQQQQDAEYLSWEYKRLKALPKPIFTGCSIFVNGHTNPSINEIHRLVVLHGGKFISYLVNKSSATHIVCDWLTPRKSELYKNCRVVKAQWIVDCVDNEELLDWKEYRLIKEVAYNQRRLKFEPISEQQEIVPEEEPEQEPEQEPEELPEELPEQEEEEELIDDHEDIPLLDSIPQDKGVHKVKDKYVLDARHPDFLAYFFANSRLHHLSIWKSDLRLKFLRRIIKEKPTKLQSSHTNRIIMHIDFDCFFATASCINHPNLDINTDAIGVSHGSRTSDIASCNYVARSFGVKNGMWITQAKQLCPQIKIIDYDFLAYENYSHEFYNYLISSDWFDIIYPVSIDEVLVDATTYSMSHDIEELCKTIRKDVYTLTKCPVSIGVGSNVLLAKLSLRKAKPNGYYLQSSNLTEFLEQVDIRDLPGIGPSITEKLSHELNQSPVKVPHVLPLSKFRLITLFGEKTGTKLYQYVRGIDETSLATPSTLGRKSVSVDVNFGIRFDTVEELDEFLIRLAKELYTRLISLGFCGSSLTLRLARRANDAPINPPKFLGMGKCDFINKSSRLGVPTNDWGVLGSEAKVLYRMVNIPVTELRGVGLSITKLVDVDSVKRQGRLEFKKGNINDQFKSYEREARTPSPSKRIRISKVQLEKQPKTSHSFDNIDWEVFEQLPSDIKKEIERELTRRGMLVKRDSNAKAYFQQLLPTQSGATNYIRVIESPTKRKPSRKSKSPVKREPVKLYQPSQSYDSSVLEELPSSIRNSVLKDVEYTNKVRTLDLIPMRDKLHLLEKQRQVKIKEIDLNWISNQNKLCEIPMFLNKKISINQLESRIKEWISMSLEQGGPHEDDINYFGEYVDEMLSMNDTSRVLLLRKSIETNLELHKSMMEFVDDSKKQLMLESVQDWNHQLARVIDPKLKKYI